jgi:hypothetical protein
MRFSLTGERSLNGETGDLRISSLDLTTIATNNLGGSPRRKQLLSNSEQDRQQSQKRPSSLRKVNLSGGIRNPAVRFEPRKDGQIESLDHRDQKQDLHAGRLEAEYRKSGEISWDEVFAEHGPWFRA